MIDQIIFSLSVKGIEILSFSPSVEKLENEIMERYREHTDLVLTEGYYDGNGTCISKDMLNTINSHEGANLTEQEFTEEETRNLYGRWIEAIISNLDLKDVASDKEETLFLRVVRKYVIPELCWKYHYIITEI